MTFLEFKKLFKERGLKIRRFRQRLTKCFGAYYWQDLTDQEFESVVDSLIIDLGKSSLKSYSDIDKF